MKKFRFPLESALHLRENRVEAEEARLAEIHTELESVRATERQLRSELRETDALSESPDAYLLWERDRFRQAAARQFERLQAQAREVTQRIEAQQQKVLEARRDRELLLKLKHKARATWQAEADKILQDLADEAFLSRWNR